jgi:hypothetical protein
LSKCSGIRDNTFSQNGATLAYGGQLNSTAGSIKKPRVQVAL